MWWATGWNRISNKVEEKNKKQKSGGNGGLFQSPKNLLTNYLTTILGEFFMEIDPSNLEANLFSNQCITLKELKLKPFTLFQNEKQQMILQGGVDSVDFKWAWGGDEKTQFIRNVVLTVRGAKCKIIQQQSLQFHTESTSFDSTPSLAAQPSNATTDTGGGVQLNQTLQQIVDHLTLELFDLQLVVETTTTNPKNSSPSDSLHFACQSIQLSTFHKHDSKLSQQILFEQFTAFVLSSTSTDTTIAASSSSTTTTNKVSLQHSKQQRHSLLDPIGYSASVTRVSGRRFFLDGISTGLVVEGHILGTAGNQQGEGEDAPTLQFHLENPQIHILNQIWTMVQSYNINNTSTSNTGSPQPQKNNNKEPPSPDARTISIDRSTSSVSSVTMGTGTTTSSSSSSSSSKRDDPEATIFVLPLPFVAIRLFSTTLCMPNACFSYRMDGTLCEMVGTEGIRFISNFSSPPKSTDVLVPKSDMQWRMDAAHSLITLEPVSTVSTPATSNDPDHVVVASLHWDECAMGELFANIQLAINALSPDIIQEAEFYLTQDAIAVATAQLLSSPIVLPETPLPNSSGSINDAVPTTRWTFDLPGRLSLSISGAQQEIISGFLESPFISVISTGSENEATTESSGFQIEGLRFDKFEIQTSSFGDGDASVVIPAMIKTAESKSLICRDEIVICAESQESVQNLMDFFNRLVSGLDDIGSSVDSKKNIDNDKTDESGAPSTGQLSPLPMAIECYSIELSLTRQDLLEMTSPLRMNLHCLALSRDLHLKVDSCHVEGDEKIATIKGFGISLDTGISFHLDEVSHMMLPNMMRLESPVRDIDASLMDGKCTVKVASVHITPLVKTSRGQELSALKQSSSSSSHSSENLMLPFDVSLVLDSLTVSPSLFLNTTTNIRGVDLVLKRNRAQNRQSIIGVKTQGQITIKASEGRNFLSVTLPPLRAAVDCSRGIGTLSMVTSLQMGEIMVNSSFAPNFCRLSSVSISSRDECDSVVMVGGTTAVAFPSLDSAKDLQNFVTEIASKAERQGSTTSIFDGKLVIEKLDCKVGGDMPLLIVGNSISIDSSSCRKVSEVPAAAEEIHVAAKAIAVAPGLLLNAILEVDGLDVTLSVFNNDAPNMFQLRTTKQVFLKCIHAKGSSFCAAFQPTTIQVRQNGRDGEMSISSLQVGGITCFMDQVNFLSIPCISSSVNGNDGEPGIAVNGKITVTMPSITFIQEMQSLVQQILPTQSNNSSERESTIDFAIPYQGRITIDAIECTVKGMTPNMIRANQVSIEQGYMLLCPSLVICDDIEQWISLSGLAVSGSNNKVKGRIRQVDSVHIPSLLDLVEPTEDISISFSEDVLQVELKQVKVFVQKSDSTSSPSGSHENPLPMPVHVSLQRLETVFDGVKDTSASIESIDIVAVPIGNDLVSLDCGTSIMGTIQHTNGDNLNIALSKGNVVARCGAKGWDLSSMDWGHAAVGSSSFPDAQLECKQIVLAKGSDEIEIKGNVIAAAPPEAHIKRAVASFMPLVDFFSGRGNETRFNVRTDVANVKCIEPKGTIKFVNVRAGMDKIQIGKVAANLSIVQTSISNVDLQVPERILAIGTIESLQVPEVGKIDRLIRGIRILLVNQEIHCSLPQLHVSLHHSNARASRSTASTSSSASNNMASVIPLAVQVDIREAHIRTCPEERVPIVISTVVARAAPRKYDIFAPPDKQTPGIDAVFTAAEIQNEMLNAKRVRCSATVFNHDQEAIHNMACSVGEAWVVAGFSSVDWRNLVGGGDSTTTKTIRLPYAHLDKLRLHLSYKGAVLGTSGLIDVDAFVGNKETTSADIISHYTKAITKKVPNFLANVELLGENAVDMTARSVGMLTMASTATGSAVGSAAGLVAVDMVGSAISSGKEARGAKKEDGYKFGDFTRGVFNSVSQAAKKGGQLRRGDGSSYELGDLTTGMVASSATYTKDNKSRLGGAGGAGVGMMVGMAVAGPLGLVAGSYLGMGAAKAALGGDKKEKIEKETSTSGLSSSQSLVAASGPAPLIDLSYASQGTHVGTTQRTIQPPPSQVGGAATSRGPYHQQQGHVGGNVHVGSTLSVKQGQGAKHSNEDFFHSFGVPNSTNNNVPKPSARPSVTSNDFQAPTPQQRTQGYPSAGHVQTVRHSSDDFFGSFGTPRQMASSHNQRSFSQQGYVSAAGPGPYHVSQSPSVGPVAGPQAQSMYGGQNQHPPSHHNQSPAPPPRHTFAHHKGVPTYSQTPIRPQQPHQSYVHQTPMQYHPTNSRGINNPNQQQYPINPQYQQRQQAQQQQNQSNTGNQEGYRFGNITRSIIASGKQKDGRDKDDGYKFGDFTRGLFGK